MLGALKNSRYKRISLVLILSLVIIFVIENSAIPSMIGSTKFIYALEPSCFLILFLVVSFKIPKVHLVGKAAYKPTVYAWAFNCSMVYVTVNILGGVVQGFGKSPYSHTLMGVIINVFAIGAVLLGRESIRAYMVSSYMRKNDKLTLVSIVLFMTLMNIRITEIMSITDMKSFTIFCSETLLPELCNNILATYLVLYGGTFASVIYLGIIETAMWLSPILPAFNWLAKGAIGVLVPVFCMIYILNSYLKMSKRIKIYKEKQESLWIGISETIGSILLIWFIVGVFSVYPSVIATGSMEPIIKPGDVILLEKMKDEKDIEALKTGDVIQFKRENILITHRIVEVLEEEGIPAYRTKGDNNSAEDREIVKAEDVKGILKKVVPKIGWPTLILKTGDPNVLDDVEF